MWTFLRDQIRRIVCGRETWVEAGYREFSTKLASSRLYFCVQQRAFCRSRGWFRRPDLRFGVPTVVLGFNACGWPATDFQARCHEEEHPEWVKPLGGDRQNFDWRYVATLRYRDEADMACQFLDGLRTHLDFHPHLAGGPLSDEERRLTALFQQVLLEGTCPQHVVSLL